MGRRWDAPMNTIPPVSFPTLQIWYFYWKQGQAWFPGSLVFYDAPFSAQEVNSFACCKLKLKRRED